MEIIDNTDTDSGLDSDFTNMMRAHLTATAKWGRFLSIISFVIIGFFILVAISMATAFRASTSDQPDVNNLKASGMIMYVAVGYFVFAVLGIIPTVYLLKFSNGLLKNISSFSRSGIEQALSNLRSLFKYNGISIIVIIVLYTLLLAVYVFQGTKPLFMH
ncbi:MAG: hypothetical protein ACTHJT_12710 [Cytophaga sp.]|uniref:hypothetical protein n=1 Tax=Cytophaga sp. TaxID=29535 RepID=UPI003F7E1EC7